MEWVRRCFRSKWRLTRGSDRLRAGYYWFCPPETPFYPGVHNFASRDWTSDERDPLPLLGEYDGKRTWYSGEPPRRRPLPILIGDAYCIEHGEPPGLPIVTNVSPECAKMQPDACYGPEDEIVAKTDVFDCVFAKLTADVIGLAYTDLPAAAAMVAAYMPAGTVVSTFPQPDPLVPAGVIATISDTVVLWLTGTTNFQQLAAQGLYFGLGPIDQGAYSASHLDETAMLAIADLMNARGLGTAGRIVLTGHSYGGAVCQVLAARMMTADPNRLVEVLTLGAPAPGDDRLQALIELLAQRHYANEFDPIPYLPPGGFAFPWLLPVVGALLIAQWAKFERPARIKQITRDGRFIDILGKDLPDDFLNVSALAIAAGADLPSFKDHTTDWYSYYLCLACRCVPRPCTRPDGEDLGFDFILQDLVWNDGTSNITEDFAANLEYDEDALVWFFNDGIDPKVRIEPTFNEFGNYETFHVVYFVGDSGNIHERFEWEFAADEMILGIDTTSNPVFSSTNTFAMLVGMGRLVIPSSFLFPPIDGDGGDGFDEVYDGDGLP